jgi:hypothetical protein
MHTASGPDERTQFNAENIYGHDGSAWIKSLSQSILCRIHEELCLYEHQELALALFWHWPPAPRLFVSAFAFSGFGSRWLWPGLGFSKAKAKASLKSLPKASLSRVRPKPTVWPWPGSRFSEAKANDTGRSTLPRASGVLGSAVREAFIASAVTEVFTRDLTRSGDGLTKLDLLNESEVEKVLHAESRCDWV